MPKYSMELNPQIEFDWVRLSLISEHSLDYAGSLSLQLKFPPNTCDYTAIYISDNELIDLRYSQLVCQIITQNASKLTIRNAEAFDRRVCKGMRKKIECDADSFPVTSAQNIA